ncbi:uncharacterized protein L3040_003271 [Drepanopeziza brunnea f. sp. 'multigermtubi']|uniref:Mannosyl transferase n=1 Tax=Marssonina brunnea f. sp. multigermtubi (strain MB_m1) TaxID=1072389 RepID=K1WEI6_MARBU|nr:uncharacterized protein MBM_05881 [Drepanopeziza brunnea f. sp. 'multigermtubi' MB_m1]EKD15870.1 hypothetical protein MBM_05881 [Drepanopeziza brunnea f. sp. 'multigermtubi' MB_m1]KAJ5047444.1 hypothetical protein L3040_003271 [Drepanopeziza brunnea f. sp. 'multigermtubi']
MMLILALLIFCIALCVLLATQPLPFLPRTRCRLQTIKQQPTHTETKLRQDVKPYQFPPLKEKTSTKMAMGLKRLDDSNWLTLDSAYLPEHTLRLQLLSSCQPDVVQMLPGSEPACHELLKTVTSFLSSRFPQHFTIASSPSGPEIVNRLTNEVYPIGPSCANPLEVAAKLSMEDFNILVRSPETGEYHLQASATLFPAGWKLQERIGTSMANLHRPVPGWNQKLGPCVNRYFDHLSHKTAMERTNVFIQTTPHLFQDAPEPTPSSPATVSQLMVRRERQTFTRLQQTGAVLFTVRTYMEPLTQLGDAELKALRSQVLGWEAEVRAYKGGDIWGPPLLRLCEERCGAVVVEVAKADEKIMRATVRGGGA